MSSFFVITKEKEGFDVPESEIPIDIHYNKFLDWLVDRKKVPSDWNKELQKLEKEIVYAKSLVANNEKFSQMINGELWIGKVEEIVKEIEKTEKGWTGSAEGNSWRRVLKHLKWKYLFLAHSARLLVSLMTYEIPALRKEGDTFQKQINDAEKKIADFTKSASELKNQHERECKKLGIKGENIEDELNELTNELPEFYKSTAKLTSGEGIQQAIDLYKKFIENMHRSFEDEEINSKIDTILSNICPLLSYVHKYGDDYIEIMEKRKRGETITENDYLIYEQLKNKKNVKEEEINIQPIINWDISDDTQVTELNFDIGEINEVHEIQWDITDETGDKEAAIQWDISVEDSGDKQASIQWDIGNEDDIVNNANNDPSERSLDTILGTTSTRNQFKDDLLELQAFLKQRLVEMENDKGSLVIQLGVQEQLGEANAAVVLPLLKLIDSILDSFNNERFRLLIDIKTSKRYTERLANSLKQKLDLAQRATSSANQYQKKVQQLITTSSSIYPKINNLSEEVKLIKKHTESELSKLYSNRPVNII